VWQSIDLDNGVHEDEVNASIARYCIEMGDSVIHYVNRNVTKYVKSLEARYSVHLYDIKDGHVNEENSEHFDTGSLIFALIKAAEFRRSVKCPQVSIYDNEEDKYIAEWN
jgi:hypothetical protein